MSETWKERENQMPIPEPINEIVIKEVEAYNRNSMPKENETIADDMQINNIVPLAKEVRVYRRDKKACPKNRGNVVIDITFKDNRILCFKLPLEMTDDHVLKFIKPLMDKLDAYKKSLMN